ncbi:MAG: Fe-S cluster assembly protein HesB [Candidatus Heimdallarchaeota archaeon]
MKDQELSKIKTFQTKIFDWWNTNKREFPWRETTDPYFVLLSEVMLQQTQATRSIEKFKQFVESFPTIDSLAEAQKSEVLKQWSGLGYNRRALWLQEAAKQIIELGDFPKFPEALQALKGIGPYTGRAILIFAFNYDLSTVDTNIRRILIAEGFASETNTEKELYDIAFKIQPKGPFKRLV